MSMDKPIGVLVFDDRTLLVGTVTDEEYVLPPTGRRGAPGPAGPPFEPDLPDLTLLFNNALI